MFGPCTNSKLSCRPKWVRVFREGRRLRHLDKPSRAVISADVKERKGHAAGGTAIRPRKRDERGRLSLPDARA